MKYNSALKHVQSIDWTVIDTRIDGSHCLLFRRFMHRAAALAMPFRIHMGRPFVHPGVFGFDVPKLPKDDISFLVETLAIQKHLIVRLVVTYHLWLCSFVDSSSDLSDSAALVYIPLLELFSDGGMIDIHHHEMIVDDKWAFGMQDWQNRYAGPEP